MSDQYRDALLTALPGCNLPGELVGWLRRGLEVHAAGGDIHTGLDLAGPDIELRNENIRTAIQLSPGISRTARCIFFVDCLNGNRTHPRPDMQRLIDGLKLMDVPASTKPLLRLLDGRTQAGWQEQRT